MFWLILLQLVVADPKCHKFFEEGDLSMFNTRFWLWHSLHACSFITSVWLFSRHCVAPQSKPPQYYNTIFIWNATRFFQQQLVLTFVLMMSHIMHMWGITVNLTCMSPVSDAFWKQCHSIWVWKNEVWEMHQSTTSTDVYVPTKNKSIHLGLITPRWTHKNALHVLWAINKHLRQQTHVDWCVVGSWQTYKLQYFCSMVLDNIQNIPDGRKWVTDQSMLPTLT